MINWYNYLIPFISGFISFLLVKYLINKYYKIQEIIPYTKDVSTTVITSREDYRKILINQSDTNYFINYGISYNWNMSVNWTIFDIKKWLNSLKNQDFAIKVYFLAKNSKDSSQFNIWIPINTEFIVNNNSNPLIISSLIKLQSDKILDLFNYLNEEDFYIVIVYTELLISP